jgi:hypothetical protein
MKNGILTLTFLAAACGSTMEPSTPLDQAESLGAGQFTEAVAELENGLAYDGCTWLVTVGEAEYAPSAAARAKIDAHTSDIGRTAARIRYRLTGAQGTVECGWNTSKTLPEIDIASISAP